MILRPGVEPRQLPGTDSAAGSRTVVWRDGDELVVAAQDTLKVLARIAAPGAEEPAVSERWLVWRAHEGNLDVMRAIDFAAPGQPSRVLRVMRAPDRLGRPSVDAGRVVFHVARRRASTIEEILLPARSRRVLRRARTGEQLLNPCLRNGVLLYVSSSALRQQLLLGPRRGRIARDRAIFAMHPTARRDDGYEPGHHRHGAGYPGGRPPRLPKRAPAGVEVTLWSTALDAGNAYVSRARRAHGVTTSEILRFKRR